MKAATHRWLWVIIGALLSSTLPASSWIYTLDIPGRPASLASDRTYLNKVAVDMNGDVYSCGVVTSWSAGIIHVVKLSRNTGQLLWDYLVPSSNNYRSMNECRS